MTTAAKKKIAEFVAQRSSFRERMKSRLEKTSAKELRDALISAGVVTSDGKLAAAYRSPEEKVRKKAEPKTRAK